LRDNLQFASYEGMKYTTKRPDNSTDPYFDLVTKSKVSVRKQRPDLAYLFDSIGNIIHRIK
jgi:hypothetical protein